MMTSAHFRAPVVGLGDEAVADLRVALGLDEVLHVVALAVDLPREIGDQRGVRGDEEEALGVHGGTSLGGDLSVWSAPIAGGRGPPLVRLLSDHVGFERADFVENCLDVRLGDAVLSERSSEESSIRRPTRSSGADRPRTRSDPKRVPFFSTMFLNSKLIF